MLDFGVELAGHQFAIKLVIHAVHLFVVGETIVIFLGQFTLAFSNQLVAERAAGVGRIQTDRRHDPFGVLHHPHGFEGIFFGFAWNTEHDVAPKDWRLLTFGFHVVADLGHEVNRKIIVFLGALFVDHPQHPVAAALEANRHHVPLGLANERLE